MLIQINMDTNNPSDARLLIALTAALTKPVATPINTPSTASTLTAKDVPPAPDTTVGTASAPAPAPTGPALVQDDTTVAKAPRKGRGKAAPAAEATAPVAAAPAPAPVAAAPAVVAAPSGDFPGEDVTSAATIAAFRKFYEAKSLPDAQAILTEFGVKRVTELKPEQRAAFIAKVAL